MRHAQCYDLCLGWGRLCYDGIETSLAKKATLFPFLLKHRFLDRNPPLTPHPAFRQSLLVDDVFALVLSLEHGPQGPVPAPRY